MLRADGIRVTFGGVCAVDGVSVELRHDELLGLVGPNGSGKTTFLNAVCGVVPAKGELAVDGQPVNLGKPRSAWDAGIARVFQAPQTFEDLACIENVLLSSSDQALRGITGAWLARPLMWQREKQRWRAAMEALELVGLARYAMDKAALLTYGQRRLLELARAVVGEPKVLLLDEPSAGLNDGETAELCDRLVAIQGKGVAVLVVDHKVDFLDVVCDRIVVLELGRVIAEGRPEVVWNDPRVMSAYLGVPEEAITEGVE
jgi:ABC-type branched-subunit amino acid transport system ATPase component